MSWRRLVVGSAVLTCAAAPPPPKWPDFGRPPSAAEISNWDIDVRPDGNGLPPGSGTAEHGRQVYEENCQGCHGANGTGGPKDRLAGGQGTLATDMPIKTIGSFWPYATTLFDYVRRAMPYQAPGTLGTDDTYAVVAYLLHINGIVRADARMGRDTLAAIRMPNRDGFLPDKEYRHVMPLRLRRTRHPAPRRRVDVSIPDPGLTKLDCAITVNVHCVGRCPESERTIDHSI